MNAVSPIFFVFLTYFWLWTHTSITILSHPSILPSFMLPIYAHLILSSHHSFFISASISPETQTSECLQCILWCPLMFSPCFSQISCHSCRLTAVVPFVALLFHVIQRLATYLHILYRALPSSALSRSLFFFSSSFPPFNSLYSCVCIRHPLIIDLLISASCLNYLLSLSYNWCCLDKFM